MSSAIDWYTNAGCPPEEKTEHMAGWTLLIVAVEVAVDDVAFTHRSLIGKCK